MSRFHTIYLSRKTKTGEMMLHDGIGACAKAFGVGAMLIAKRSISRKEFSGHMFFATDGLPLINGAGI